MLKPKVARRLDGLLERVEDLMGEDRLEEALEVAREARALHPKSPDLLCLEGGLLGELGQTEEAMPLFEAALALDKNNLEALGALADLHITVGSADPEETERGLALCKRGLKVAKAAGDVEILAELSLIEGIGLSNLGAYAGALQSFERARPHLGDDPELMQERGIALFHLWRFEEAKAELEALVATEPEAAWAHHYLALIAERRGDRDAMELHFARARALAPEEIPAPVVMDSTTFDEVVEAAIAELPEKVRRYISNVAIAVEDFPRVEEFGGDETVTPTVLGVFRGNAISEQSTFDPWSHFPSSILLFQKNLERSVASKEELIDEIAITLLHEVGHFLGFGEDDLRERDLD